MILTGKPLLALKIISALCLLYMAQYYLLFAISFQIGLSGLFAPASGSILLAVLAGATLISCSFRQFLRPVARLLPFALLVTVLAHISMFFMIIWLEQSYATSGFNELLNIAYPDGEDSISNMLPQLIKDGLVHLLAFIIPFIVNFRKQPPIAPVFD